MEENIQQNKASCLPIETVPARKVFSKKKLTVILSAVIIVLCVVAATIINANRPINRFEHALKAGEYDVALAIYEQNNSDEKFVAKTIEKVSALLSSSLKKYADGSMSYEDMNTLLDKTGDYKDVKNHSETESQVKQIQASKEAYEQAEASVENKTYLKALENYAKVIEEDTENYSPAQKAITLTAELLCSDAIEQATDFMSQNDAVKAFEALSAVGNYKNDAVTQMLTEVTEKAREQIVGQAKALTDSENYKEAYYLLVEQPDTLKDEKVKEIEKKALDSMLTQLKKTVEVNYDSIYKLYTIWPIKWGDNVVPGVMYALPDTPLLSGDLDNVSFSMHFSFINDNWIFMDTIFIDCVGTQFSLKVDASDRMTDVLFGGKIIEGVNYYHIPNSTEAGANGHADLSNIVDAIESSNKITVRFSGKGGYKDIILTRDDVKDVSNIWIIYSLLYENPSLVNALI